VSAVAAAGNTDTFERRSRSKSAASFLPTKDDTMTATTKAQLNRYFERIEEHLPAWLCRFFRWLRRPSSRIARILVAALLIFGSLLSFLPVLGIWMFPLGLIIISQDLPFLQRPLVRSFQWIETTWKRLQQWRVRRPAR
jgi:hypothetical protein